MERSRSRLGQGVVLVLASAVVLSLAGCAPGPNELENLGGPDQAGFWQGVWHGFIAPVTFLISLFTQQVNVFEVHNDGNWYSFGFMIGLAIGSSGAASSGAYARNLKKTREGGTS
jgi:MFS-type transporter involved in bile tolerance (Atg22 family)